MYIEENPSKHLVPRVIVQLWRNIDLHAQRLLRRILLASYANEREDAVLLMANPLDQMKR